MALSLALRASLGRQFFWNVRYPLAITTLLIVANCIYETFHSLHPALPEFASTVIWDVFRQGTFVLSIVLGMKINQVYQRYWLARQSYGGYLDSANALALAARTRSLTRFPRAHSHRHPVVRVASTRICSHSLAPYIRLTLTRSTIASAAISTRSPSSCIYTPPSPP